MSEASIIREFIELRMKLASSRHEDLFFDNITGDHSRENSGRKTLGIVLADILPARNEWAAFRPNRQTRRSIDSGQVNLLALQNATFTLMNRYPTLPWAVRLRERTLSIQSRALESHAIEFRCPMVSCILKEKSNHNYRPISKYAVDDGIILKLAARHLSKQFDPYFSDASYAYRCARKAPLAGHNREAALRQIVQFMKRNPIKYVAEADLRNFMDCIDHGLTRSNFGSFVDYCHSKNPNITINQRDHDILNAYLKSYSFKSNVIDTALPQLHKRDPNGVIPWPENELREMRCGGDLDDVGIPQGGSLSCLIVNLMMHDADQSVTGIRVPNGHELMYLRYCDDMLILSTDLGLCRDALAIYEAAIRRQMLPMHPAVDVREHSEMVNGYPAYLNQKSKLPYRWSHPDDGGIPWIQFLGFLIRYDGQFEIRPKSIQKQIDKINEISRKLHKTINPHRISDKKVPICARELRMSPEQILRRFRMKLAMSVGRIKPRQRLPSSSDEIKPMCWAHGFKFLWEVPYDPSQLKKLDHHRERILRMAHKLLIPLMKNKRPIDRRRDGRSKSSQKSAVYSYYGQFAKKAELNLIPPIKIDPPRHDPTPRFRYVVSSILHWIRRW